MMNRIFRVYYSIVAGKGLGRIALVQTLVRGSARGLGLSAAARWIMMRRPAQIGGMKLYYDPRANSAHIFGKGWNRKEEACVRDIVRPGDLAIDVGANIGFFTVLCGLLAGPGGRVLAIEPMPSNINTMRRNLKLNGLQNVEIVQCACSDFVGSGVFQDGENLSVGRLARSNVRGGRLVQISSIDSLLASDDRPVRFIKVDVEGAELMVLHGAKKAIERSPELHLLMEYNDQAFAEFGYSGDELLTFMADQKFEAFDVRKNRPFVPEPGTTNVLFRRAV